MTTPRATVVYESMFGSTAEVAAAVAAGLGEEGFDVSCADVALADLAAPLQSDLLVIGAPTHAFSLSRPATREDAVRRGALPSRAVIGVREWLSDLHPAAASPAPLVAVFDTRAAKVRRIPSAAGRSAARLAHRAGFRLLCKPTAFLVGDVRGPILAGELERARSWGRDLACAARAAHAARAAQAAKEKATDRPGELGTKGPSVTAPGP